MNLLLLFSNVSEGIRVYIAILRFTMYNFYI